VFCPHCSFSDGIDDTIERRRGKNGLSGIYRDPVRSSDEYFVKASGLRWLSLMLLVKIPWRNGLEHYHFHRLAPLSDN